MKLFVFVLASLLTSSASAVNYQWNHNVSGVSFVVDLIQVGNSHKIEIHIGGTHGADKVRLKSDGDNFKLTVKTAGVDVHSPVAKPSALGVNGVTDIKCWVDLDDGYGDQLFIYEPWVGVAELGDPNHPPLTQTWEHPQFKMVTGINELTFAVSTGAKADIVKVYSNDVEFRTGTMVSTNEGDDRIEIVSQVFDDSYLFSGAGLDSVSGGQGNDVLYQGTAPIDWPVNNVETIINSTNTYYMQWP